MGDSSSWKDELLCIIIFPWSTAWKVSLQQRVSSIRNSNLPKLHLRHLSSQLIPYPVPIRGWEPRNSCLQMVDSSFWRTNLQTLYKQKTCSQVSLCSTDISNLPYSGSGCTRGRIKCYNFMGIFPLLPSFRKTPQPSTLPALSYVYIHTWTIIIYYLPSNQTQKFTMCHNIHRITTLFFN